MERYSLWMEENERKRTSVQRCAANIAPWRRTRHLLKIGPLRSSLRLMVWTLAACEKSGWQKGLAPLESCLLDWFALLWT